MFDDATDRFPARRLWLNAAHSQIRVIAALIRRETQARFGERRLGYLWAIIEPALHLAGYYFLFAYLWRRSSPLTGSLALFMLSGLMPFFLFAKVAGYVSGAIGENRALLNLPPVKPVDVLISRGILETTTYSVVGALFLLFFYLTGTPDTIPYHPHKLAAAIAGISALGFGIGIINAVMRAFVRSWMTIFGLVLGPAFLLSGIWFLPDAIPPPFRDYLLYNPLMHYIMWARTGLYRNYQPAELDQAYAIWSSIFAVVLGLTLLRVARRKVLEPT